MAFLQTSVTEIFKAIELARKLYGCFTDEYDGATNRLRELQDTFEFLSTTFNDYSALLEQCNRTYPAQESLLKKLKELHSFIQKYSAVAPEGSASSRSMTRRIWQTTRFAFNQHLDRLNDGLKMEMQKLALSMGQLALNMNVPAVSSQTFQPSGASSNATSMDSFVRTLRLAKNQYEREMSNAAIRGHRPNTLPIEQKVEGAIRRLCYDVGLSDSYVPVVSGRELLRCSSHSWNRVVINTANASSHDPIRYDPALFQRLETGVRQYGVETLTSDASNTSDTSVSNLNGITAHSSPLLPCQHGAPPSRTERAPLLGEPVPMLGTTTIFVAGHGKLVLQYWSLPDRGARIHWKEAKGGLIIEHWIASDAIPYTKHKTLNEPLAVEFLRVFRVVVRDTSSLKLDCKAKAKYLFTKADDRDRFQEDVRGKTMVQTFDVTRIKCKSSSILTSNETLTIWRDRHNEQLSSISFYINSDPKFQRHEEFYLSWFLHEIRVDAPNRSVDLEFARARKGSKTPPTKNQRGSIFHKPSFGLSSSPESCPVSSPTPHRSSMTTFSSSDSTGDEQAHAPQDYIEKYKSLNIKFSTDQDFSDFVSRFKEAKEADAFLFSRPESTFESSRPLHELDNSQIEPRPPDPFELYGDTPYWQDR